MKMRRGGVFMVLALAFCMTSPLEAQLKVGFYKNTCPQAEKIVNEEVTKAFVNDDGILADFVRMHFHDCFVRGCDGSILLDSTPGNTAEKDSPINNPSLEGFDIIDNAKTRLEAACKGVVSCADIVAFAARDSVLLSKGFFYDVPSGRRDGRVSISAETFANLPPPFFNLTQLIENFARKGLTQEDLVTLSGAHSIGKADCSAFTDRLYNFSSTGKPDPSLDPAYAAQLRKLCPPSTTGTSVPMDPPSPLVLDSSYYKGITDNRGLFTSDQALLASPATAFQVWAYRKSNVLFNFKFAKAMVKMGNIGVLTGTAGEVRLKCNVVNNRSPNEFDVVRDLIWDITSSSGV